ncbi:hypothetical protein BN12_4000010 [Nostocoides japonicum T1-X7]|uniref:Uncharacterized protein n=1 Tax=Nostocoides japonicum T1-X7 TaxID=1194083 RepID=A0A077LYX9_9MICO|nr:hypothetical protein BN12_4000010 [Tetrasphaera japonica T1-X7]
MLEAKPYRTSEESRLSYVRGAVASVVRRAIGAHVGLLASGSHRHRCGRCQVCCAFDG